MLFSMGLCIVASASAAPLLVDDFTSLAPQSLTQTGVGASDTWAGGGAMLGGSRGLIANVTTSMYGLASKINIVAGVGAVSDNAGNAGDFWFGYLTTGGTGSGGLFYSTSTDMDLSAFSDMEIDMLSSDKAFTLEVVWASDFSQGSWMKAFGPIASPTTISIGMADYAGGSWDPSNVDAFAVRFHTAVDGDLGMREIRLVPEPASLAVLGLGILGATRKRRNA